MHSRPPESSGQNLKKKVCLSGFWLKQKQNNKKQKNTFSPNITLPNKKRKNAAFRGSQPKVFIQIQPGYTAGDGRIQSYQIHLQFLMTFVGRMFWTRGMPTNF